MIEMLEKEICNLLERLAGGDVAEYHRNVLRGLVETPIELSAHNTALLIIDPQHSFTSGRWKQSIGPNGDIEVAPICLAFDNCARLLTTLDRSVETMFTRCPFPGSSFDWDRRLCSVLDDKEPFFIKPGNSVLWPPNNGYREWVESFVARGKNRLVMGGCTLNSCVRVSAMDTVQLFKDSGLQVIADLSICGARTCNYVPSTEYDGISSVESAIRQMKAAGVQVIHSIIWQKENLKG